MLVTVQVAIVPVTQHVDGDLTGVTRAELAAVARELNARPRQALNWMKPCEVFGRAVASTA